MGEENNEVFKCEECGREFDSARGLSIHERVHTDKEEAVEEESKTTETKTPYIVHH